MECVVEDSRKFDHSRYVIFGLLVIGFALLALVAMSTTSQAEGTTYNWGSPYTVAGTEVYTNDTINAACNVNVPAGATLRLENTTLNIQNSFCIITVWGTFEMTDIDNDNTTTGDRSELIELGDPTTMDIGGGANVLIEYSYIDGLGGQGASTFDISANANNMTVHHTYIEDGDRIFELTAASSFVVAHNNTIDTPLREVLTATATSDLTFYDNWVFNKVQNGQPVINVNNLNLDLANNIFEDNPGVQVHFMGGTGKTLKMNGDVIKGRTGASATSYGVMASTTDAYVYIYDCSIDNTSNDAIHVQNTEYFEIVGNIITDSLGDGIWIQFGSGYILDNVITDPSQTGITIDGPSTDCVDIDNNTIISSNSYAIFATDMIANVTNNTVRSSFGYGIYLYELSGGVVEHNDIRNGDDLAIYTYDAFVTSYDDNTLMNHPYEWVVQVSYPATQFNFTNNVIADGWGGVLTNDWANNNWGIIFENNSISGITDTSLLQIEGDNYGGRFSIQNNDFTDNYDGIDMYMYDYNTALYLRDNTFTNTTYTTVYINFDGNYLDYIGITGNTIDEALSGMYLTNIYTYEFDFENNTISNIYDGNALYTNDFYPQWATYSVQNNDITDVYAGIGMEINGDLEALYCRNNDIDNSTYDWALNFYVDEYWIEYVGITDNTIDDSAGGVYLYDFDTYEFDFENNTISDSDDYALEVDYIHPNDGPISIQNNDIDNVPYGISIRIYDYASGLYIRDNTFDDVWDDWALDIRNYWYNDVDYIGITDNTIDDCYGGIYLEYFGDNNEFEFENNTISDLSDDPALYIEYLSPDDGYFSVQNNDLTNVYYGIYLYLEGSMESFYFRNNDIVNSSDYYSLYLYNDWYNADYMAITDNYNDGYYGGIYVYDVYIGKLDVRDNTVTNMEYDGMYFHYVDGPLNFTDNTITNVSYDDNDYYGIYIDGDMWDYPSNILRNNVSNNNQYAYNEIWGLGDVLIQDNHFNENYYGLMIDGNKITVIDNEFNFNNQYGFYIDDAYDDLYILGTHFDNNTEYGFYLEESDEADIYIGSSYFNGNEETGAYIVSVTDGSYILIENSFFDWNHEEGLQMEYIYDVAAIDIMNCSFDDNEDDYGVYFAYIYTYGTVLFENCTFDRNWYGFESYELYIEEIAFVDCYFRDNHDYAIYAYYMYGGDVVVDPCVITGNGWDDDYEAVYIGNIYDGNVLVTENTFANSGWSNLYIDNIYGGWVEVSNNTFEGTEYSIYTYYIYGDMWFENNYVANSTEYGAEFDDHRFGGMLYIRDNHFYTHYEQLYIYRSDVIIENNIFERSSYGIYAYSDLSMLFIFRNNTMVGISEYCLYFQYYNYRSGSGIYDNTFRGFGGTALEFSTSAANYLPVFNNLFTQGHTGIYVEDGVPDIHHNTFKILTEGIYVEDRGITLHDNTFTNCWEFGIYLDSAGSSSIIDNTFHYSYYGLYVWNTPATITGNTFGQNSYGIELSQTFATLADNDFLGNDYGISVEDYSFIEVLNGDFQYNGYYGIWSEQGTFTSWTVSGQSTVTSDSLVLNGNLEVRDGGALTIDDSTVILRSFGGGGYSIMVNAGGTLDATGSTFRPFNDTKPYGIVAPAGSTLSLEECVLEHLGGGLSPKRALYIATPDVVLEKVSINGSNSVSLFIEGGVEIAMRNGSISNSNGYDVFIQNDSILRMGNTMFNHDNNNVLDTSKIIIERIISIKALDDGDLPYQGVSVTITDDENNTIQGTTDASGLWYRFFEGAIISSTARTDTSITYNILVSDGSQDFKNEVLLKKDFVKTYRFGSPPTVLNGTSAIVMDEDTTYEIDLSDYFLDNDALVYTVKGNSSLTFAFAGHTCTIIPVQDWFGVEEVSLVATDTHKMANTYKLIVTVNPVNDIPVISGVPDLVLMEDEIHIMEVMPFIYDPDTSQSGLTVSVDSIYVEVSRTTLTFEFPDPSIQYVRIHVADHEGGTSQDILVSVREVNDPPEMKDIPVFDATEDVEVEIDLAPYLFDEDDNVSLTKITSDSMFVVAINGTKVTFLFPDGPTQRFAPITLSDGNAEATYMIEFYVMPDNDAPEIAQLPLVTVTEGVDLIFDLTGYVSDIDNDLEDLSIRVIDPANMADYAHVTVEGLRLIINIPDGGSMITLTVQVSDGFLTGDTVLRISVIPVNDPPQLTNPKGPKSGTEGQDFKFSVTFTDPDAKNPTVYVVVNGKKYAMKMTTGDYATGAVFEINLKNVLKDGEYTYHFEAEDGSGEPNGYARTEDFTGLNISQEANYGWIIGLLIVLIIIAILLLVLRPKKQKDEPIPIDDEDEETTLAEEDDEVSEEE